MHFIGYQGIKLHYRQYGQGQKVLLAFHGFGQDSRVFTSYEEQLGAQYSIFAFDLFYHGKSWLPKSKAPLQKKELANILALFLKEHQIDTFSVLGFSMGGKLALTVTEAFPERIQTLYLLAPDGIATSFWYNVATYPGYLQELFKRSVVQPGMFNKAVKFLYKSGLADKGLLKFASLQMNTVRKRLQIYRSWVGFRELTFDKRKIAELLNQNQIKVLFFIGLHDKVINARQIKSFANKIKNARLILLKSGHSTLVQEVGRYLGKEI